MIETNNNFSLLCRTISELRSENGCPWDKKQTVQSLKQYIREESDELLEAMDENNPDYLCEEIGDVIFLLILLSQINSDSNHFTIEEVLAGINQKMIRRHPHVFAGLKIETDEDLKKIWEKIKSEEKRKK